MNVESTLSTRMMAVSDTLKDCCVFCGYELCSCLDPNLNPDSPYYKQVILTEEEWEHHFGVLDNHLDKNPSFGGLMFETYGEEYDYVAAIGLKEPNRIWTYIDKEDGTTAIINHWGFEGIIGYFITEKPYDDNLNIIVQLEDEDDEDDD